MVSLSPGTKLAEPNDAKITGGAFVVVVGPSGAGKDTIIDFARERLGGRDDVLFIRRVVTRPAGAVGEDHDALDAEAFETAEAAGAFAFTWSAHGLRYGLPKVLDEHLAAGGVAVANGSRATLPQLARRYPGLVAVNLAVSRDVLARRLAERGRETPDEIADRLKRAERLRVDAGNCVEIGNDGPVEEAGNALVGIIEAGLRKAAIS